MRRVLAAAVLVAFMPTANAQDKGKSDLSTNAEYRARYFYQQNPTAKEITLGNKSWAEGRFKLGMNFKANEKLSATLTVLHNATFGVDNNYQSGANTITGTTNNNPTGAVSGVNDSLNDGDNLLAVSQAFATWLAADDLMFMVGRMNLQFGDGTLVGLNDWQKQPWAWEGALGGWEQEWGKLWLGGFKLRNPQTGGTVTSASGDPQNNAYVLAFDLKTMPEWLKTVHVHVVKNNSDAVSGGGGAAPGFAAYSTNGLDILRYGTNLAFAFGPFDAKAWYENQSGEQKAIASGTGAKTNRDYEGDLMAAEFGFTAANFMASRFFLRYHQDTGDKNTADAKMEGYDLFANEMHGAAGMMDLFNYGNLTMISAGWTFKTGDNTDVGFNYHMFSRTESGSTTVTAQSFVAGNNGTALATANGAGNNTKDGLGDEIDLWATHTYNPSFSNTLRLGYFMPGDYFKDTATNNSDDKILHVMIEGKATF